MSDKKKKPQKKKPTSALNVRPGKVGGHDGMPPSKVRADSKAPAGSKKPKAAARPELALEEYVDGVLAGDRTILGRAITLVESNAPEHEERAQELLKTLSSRAGRSIRVGVTGLPGSGKSTLIETLGSTLTDREHKVAVLAVDPSSSVSRGSILGDKTRMDRLARNRRAFIRPSPTGGTLGGVARKTRETIVLFEAAGYDVILIETVGVGQNEIAVRSMVDFFLLLLVAGTGDELQGIKKGVIEIADALVVNKADGENRIAAEAAREQYGRALHYLRPATSGWRTEAFSASALTGDGVDTIWTVVETFQRLTEKSGVFERRRREQARDWLHQMIAERLTNNFYSHPAIVPILPAVEQDVIDGRTPAARAAMNLLKKFDEGHTNSD